VSKIIENKNGELGVHGNGEKTKNLWGGEDPGEGGHPPWGPESGGTLGTH